MKAFRPDTLLLLALIGFAGLFPVPSARAAERILDYHSDISVQQNGAMKVTETIQVNAEGKRIRRGIYRDFPTDYRDRLGNRYRVGFAILGVTKNGRTEPYHTQKLANGVRVYVGSSNTYLAHGTYTYAISYSTDRQLGFFKDHDELYWNVTGNGWAFTIDHASALLRLPPGIPPDRLQTQAYTGAYGANGQDYIPAVEADGTVSFTTSRALGPHQGLTIVVGWPKGFVHEPDTGEKVTYVLHDNRHLFIAVVGFMVLLVYYLAVWNRVGRDPAKGVIFPLYEPPQGFSPASMRFIEKMGYDNTCFAAAIINLAVKGYLRIREAGKDYVLEKTGKEVEMAPGEKALVTRLMPGASRSITLEQENHKTIKDALNAHEAALERNYEKVYFMTNRIFFFIGVAITLAVLVATLFSMPAGFSNQQARFMLIWLTVWSFGTLWLIKSALRAWFHPRGAAKIFAAVATTLFTLPFLAFEVLAAQELIKLTSWSLFLLIIFAVCINWLFYELLKAPTRAGRKLLDKIEGFRKYIDLAERMELDYKYPKGRSPELFELYLPYALALGLEQQWSEQFATVLSKAQVSDAGQPRGRYHPSWYSGGNWNPANVGGFTSSLAGSFTGAISSSSTAPGSSSGMGGGGFSGGGGGGGGGGGW